MLFDNIWHRFRRPEKAEEEVAEVTPIIPPPPIPGPDGFPIVADSPLFSAHRLINEFYSRITDRDNYRQLRPSQDQASRWLLDEPVEDQASLVQAILERMAWLDRNQNSRTYPSAGFDCLILRTLVGWILRRKMSCTMEQAERLVAQLVEVPRLNPFRHPINGILKLCEEAKEVHGGSDQFFSKLEQLKASLIARQDSSELRELRARIDGLLGKVQAQGLEAGEAWSDAVLNYLARAEESRRLAWQGALLHAQTAEQARPAVRWTEQAKNLLTGLGKDEFRHRVLEWFPLFQATREVDRTRNPADQPNLARNCDILKGLVWCCSLLEDEALIQAVDQLAEKCFKKVPGWGPLSTKIGNACLYTLQSLPGMLPVTHLSRLKLRVKHAGAQRLIQRALEEAAQRMGVSGAELEELAAPTCGLEDGGVLREGFGEFTAQVRVVGTHETELTWLKADGSVQKSVPAAVREKHAEELKELKRTIQDIETMLPAQRDRLERMFLEEREWDCPQWRERYLDHPLVGLLARRLIWQFTLGVWTTLGIWRNGVMVDVEGHALDWFAPETRVRLWHPIMSPVGVAGAWRRWLEAHEVTQPFKQAHREVYVLTDAERETNTYSNRFAAHIIKQHQFAALAKQRGWQYALQGMFDGSNLAVLALPRWNYRIEFWVNPPEPGEDMTDAGIHLYLSTDQVRFSRPGEEPVPLTTVPAFVFSEVMRDVDLFVGVCSVGNDPSWRDTGPQPYGGYWENYAFGELSATANTRRELLDRMLSKLKIAAQCELQDRFLVVRGSLRTYKIHLGSGNILMSPNDQYLCIVPKQSPEAGKDRVFLPFEGDTTLSVILSKAFLLAADAKIKDATILRQINRR